MKNKKCAVRGYIIYLNMILSKKYIGEIEKKKQFKIENLLNLKMHVKEIFLQLENKCWNGRRSNLQGSIRQTDFLKTSKRWYSSADTRVIWI